MTITNAADQFLMGGGASSAKFSTIGDTVTGTIAEAPEVKQQTDLKDGAPLVWPSGDPKMQLVVTLQTETRDDADDDGKRRLYIKGKSLTDATREAVKAVGAKGLEIGGTLTVTYVGDGEASQRGFNPPKLYKASYVRPDTTAQQAGFFGGGEQAAPAPAQQPAAAPVAAPQAAPAPAPAPAAAAPQGGPTPEQLAAVKAAGLDPATVFPGYTQG